MSNQTAACLQSTFREIADGKLNPNKFGLMVQSAIRLNLTSKEAVAAILGVQPSHVFTKANTLKHSEIKDLCKKLDL